MAFEKYYQWCQSLELEDSIIVKRYIDFLSSQNEDNGVKTESSKKDYLDKLKTFLSKLTKPIKAISLFNIKEYIDNLNSDNYKNSNQHALFSFFDFVNNYYTLSFSPLSIKTDIIPQNKMIKPNAVKPLLFDDIVKLKRALRNAKKPKYDYIFEMVYSYGESFDLELSDLLECNAQNYDSINNCFTLSKKQIPINQKIQKLITTYPDVLEKMSKSSYQKYFNDMGELIHQDLSFFTIRATSRMHSMNCPRCQKKILCNSENWCLANHQNDIEDTKWLICMDCALELAGEKIE